MLVSLSGDSVLAVGVYVSGFLFLCSLAIHWRPTSAGMTAEVCSGPLRTRI